jgi:hypothetical protein
MSNVVGNHAPGLGDMDVSTLLFADDACLLSNTPVGLQRMLSELDKYCEEWSLKVNVKKTKVTVFRRGGKLATNERWYYKNEQLEVVPVFTYLGTQFASSGKWLQHSKNAVKRGKLNSLRLIKFCYRNKKCKMSFYKYLFDTLITPSVLYGSELCAWSKHVDVLDQVARQFFKSVIGLPKSAQNTGVDLLLGRTPYTALAKIRALNLWLRINRKSDDSLAKKALTLQKQMMESGRQCWARDVKEELDKLDLEFLWTEAENISVKKCKKIIKQRVMDKSFEEMKLKIRDAPSCSLLVEKDIPFGMVKEIETLDRNNRRLYSMIMLDCPGSLLDRKGTKSCASCSTNLEGTISSFI